MTMGLFGGLAPFLFGMEQMSDALKSALGDQVKTLPAKLTRNRLTGALTGVFDTQIINWTQNYLHRLEGTDTLEGLARRWFGRVKLSR